MKYRAFTLVEFIVVVVIIGILAAILFPMFALRGHGTNDRKASCLSNLRQIGLGFAEYVQDDDEKYPPVANARAGYWAGSLHPYLKSWWIFQCPSDSGGIALKTTDYFYNALLAQSESGKIESPSLTILSGDGKGDQLPPYHLSQLPDAWRTDEKSPAHRHVDGANYVFADGHVKWLKPDKITLYKPSKGQPTFEVKP